MVINILQMFLLVKVVLVVEALVLVAVEMADMVQDMPLVKVVMVETVKTVVL